MIATETELDSNDLLDRGNRKKSCRSQSAAPAPLRPLTQTTYQKRIALLPDKDQLLLQLALEQRLSRREIGVILGLSAGNVTRRLQRLFGRLRDPLVVALAENPARLSEDVRQVGLSYFLLAETIAEIARQRNRPEREIRAVVNFIRGWHRGLLSSRGA
jgi:DNA-directed RNA polymerase specialized sigma24 family protein